MNGTHQTNTGRIAPGEHAAEEHAAEAAVLRHAVEQLAHALSLPREQGGPLGEWTRLLQRVQTQTQALRRLRRSLAEVRDAAADLLEISPEDEDPRLTEARRAMVEQGMRAQEAQMRLARVREICSRWGWTEDQIASLLALPGEPRTHVFPSRPHTLGLSDEVAPPPPPQRKP